jgi:hypothetical protein
MSKIKLISLTALTLTFFVQESVARKNQVFCDVNNAKFHNTDVVKTPVLKVQTADIFLVKKNADDTFSTFIGKKNYAPFDWNLPGGKCTSSTTSPQAIAGVELAHDTAGHVTVNKWILDKAPTLYSPKASKAIFFVRDDRLTSEILKEGTHHSLGHWHKGFGPREMSEFKEIDLRHFMAKLQDYSKIVNAQQNDPKKLAIEAKDGTKFEFSASTSLALADKYDLLRNLLTQISGSQF